MTMQEAMILCWQKYLDWSISEEVDPMYADAFMESWNKCRAECVSAVLSELVGNENESLDATDISYNMAIRDAVEAIRKV